MGKMKKNILWISPFAPYENVSHAGGKTHNFYLNNVWKDGYFELYLISCYREYERKFIDKAKYGFPVSFSEIPDNGFRALLRKIINIESTINPFNRNAGIIQNYYELELKSQIKRFYKTKKTEPDVIVLQWTQAVLLLPYIKKYFPKSKVISIEEDVSFLGYERKVAYSKKLINKKIMRYKYRKLKRMELEILGKSDLVVVNNYKDYRILLDEKIEKEKLLMIPPYFDNYSKCNYQPQSNDILFFGSMSRAENYLSAIWFIENVLPKLPKNCRFIVVGGHPNEALIKYASDQVLILGFVDNVSSFFEESLCLVAPLVLGAGIKVKILESLSAGIPVLTNKIGIEGIPATNQQDFMLCENPDDYVNAINILLDDVNKRLYLSKNARKFVMDKYNLDDEIKVFIEKLKII